MATAKQIAEEFGFVNVDAIIEAAKLCDIPLHVAFALIQMESWGKNIFGNDRGGMFKGLTVTEERYYEMVKAVKNGHVSNGVGPLQITWKGFFPDSESKGIKLWIVKDNLIYGFKLIDAYYKQTDSWYKSGLKYNGARTYADVFAKRIDEWDTRLKHLASTKSFEEIAQEVIDGKWGNGQTRINNLINAGYDPDQIQAKVNQLARK